MRPSGPVEIASKFTNPLDYSMHSFFSEKCIPDLVNKNVVRVH